MIICMKISFIIKFLEPKKQDQRGRLTPHHVVQTEVKDHDAPSCGIYQLGAITINRPSSSTDIWRQTQRNTFCVMKLQLLTNQAELNGEFITYVRGARSHHLRHADNCKDGRPMLDNGLFCPYTSHGGPTHSLVAMTKYPSFQHSSFTFHEETSHGNNMHVPSTAPECNLVDKHNVRKNPAAGEQR